VRAGRKGLGVELKPSYYRQAVKNVHAALTEQGDQGTLDLPTNEPVLSEEP
jgi:hypothetical protein